MSLDPDSRFGHGINSRATLTRFIAGRGTVAEGDVTWGRLRTGDGVPCAIMAHPPNLRSDVSFADWVDAALTWGHGIKVDLKCREVIPTVLDTLTTRRFDPGLLMVNADVVRGPGGEAPRLQIEDLLPFRTAFGAVLVSLGATTGPGGGAYAAEEIQALLTVADRIGGPVTIPIRAECALADFQILEPILAAEHSLTIWNAPDTFAATERDYRDFRNRFPNAFIDLRAAEGVAVFMDHSEIGARNPE